MKTMNMMVKWWIMVIITAALMAGGLLLQYFAGAAAWVEQDGVRTAVRSMGQTVQVQVGVDVPITLHRRTHHELTVALAVNGVAVATVYQDGGSVAGTRQVFYNEEFIISPAESASIYTLTIISRADYAEDVTEASLTLIPRRNKTPRWQEIVRFSSPSCLQLALFAHMAYFPFNFTIGQLPDRASGYNPFHYAPFVDYVLAVDHQQVNRFGFNFYEQMQGWVLERVYNDAVTGFGAAVFTNDRAVVFALRGTDGGIMDALLRQTGSWWCNLQSLGGYQHSHVYSMEAFFNRDDINALMRGADVYITGHSLGGFLSYRAAYMLAMREVDIARVLTFNAPLFYVQTVYDVTEMNAVLRSRISHLYVQEDLIAGLLGIRRDIDFPPDGGFQMLYRLIRTLDDTEGVDVHTFIRGITGGLALGTGMIPVNTFSPEIRRVLWWLDGALQEEARQISADFQTLVWHETVTHTWPNPGFSSSRWIANTALGIVNGIIEDIYNMGSHYMMNFYSHLLGG
jgi:hypothetical protein